MFRSLQTVCILGLVLLLYGNDRCNGQAYGSDWITGSLKYFQQVKGDSSIFFVTSNGSSIKYGELKPKSLQVKNVYTYNFPGTLVEFGAIKLSEPLKDESTVHSFTVDSNGLYTIFSKVDLSGNIVNSKKFQPGFIVQSMKVDSNNGVHVVGGDTLKNGYYILMDSNLTVQKALRMDSIGIRNIIIDGDKKILLGTSNKYWYEQEPVVILLDSTDSIMKSKLYSSSMLFTLEDRHPNAFLMTGMKLDSTSLLVVNSRLIYASANYSESDWMVLKLSDLNCTDAYVSSCQIFQLKSISDSMGIAVGTVSDGIGSIGNPMIFGFNKAPSLSNGIGYRFDKYGPGSILSVNSWKTGSTLLLGAVGWGSSNFMSFSEHNMSKSFESACSIDTPSVIIGQHTPSIYQNNDSFQVFNYTQTTTSLVPKSSILNTYNYCGVLGVEENDLGTLIVSPNPSTGILRISYSGLNEVKTIKVYNSTGRLVMLKSNLGEDAVINLGNVFPGLYFVQVSSDQQTLTKKVILSP